MSIILKRDKGSEASRIGIIASQLNKKMMNEAKLEALKFNESVETVMKNINQRTNSSDTISPKEGKILAKCRYDYGAGYHRFKCRARM